MYCFCIFYLLSPQSGSHGGPPQGGVARKNDAKMYQKWSQNGAKSSPRGVPEASWRRPGIVFFLLDPLGRVWARFWRRPEAQDGLLAASWRDFGGQDGAKTEPKSIKNRKQKSIIFRMPLEIAFWLDFNRFWNQNGAKLASKMKQKSISISKSYLKKNFVFPKEFV